MIQVIVASAVALFVALLFTPGMIRLIVKKGYGQRIREDGPQGHQTKQGTPTMGGLVILLATVLGYTVAHLGTLFTQWAPPTTSGLLVLLITLGLGAVGFADDYLKVKNDRSLGLRGRSKLALQGAVALTFGALALGFPDSEGLTPASTAVSITRDTGLVLGGFLFLVWAYLIVSSTSNAVNLTDGLDGLATGAAVMTFGAYVMIGVWQFGHRCTVAVTAGCYNVRDPLDLAVVAAALTGACFGFLWWNAPPAKIFMGDTGSLALGGAIAGLAILTRTELLLILLGGLYVLITSSVIAQVASFKLTGKRLFRMAPLQHHFELGGWSEVTVVVRFWIISGLLVATGVGTFYGEWLTAAP